MTVNRRDPFAIPRPSAVHLWRGLHVRDVRRVDGRTRTNNVRIDLVVEGSTSRAIAFGNFAEARRRRAQAPFRALIPPPFQGGGAKTDSRTRLPWVDEDKPWTCGLEFDYVNEESFYCRSLRLDEGAVVVMTGDRERFGGRWRLRDPYIADVISDEDDEDGDLQDRDR